MADEPTTPAGVRLVAVRSDGTSENVTEGVQVLYDHLIQSMDWGSGFLSVEDVLPILALARTCGFQGLEEAEEYVRERSISERRRACNHGSFRYTEPPAGYQGGTPYILKVCTQCGWDVATTREEEHIPKTMELPPYGNA